MKTKLKTRKTATKRFKKTASGKLIHEKTGMNHLMRKKDSAHRRRLLAADSLEKGDRKRVVLMLGEGR